MADEESLRQVAQSHAPFSVWLGIVLLFALFGVIVLAIIGPAPRGDSYEQTRVKKRLDNLKKLRDEDAKALTTYAWVDKDKRLTRIPIERSMELTVAQLAQFAERNQLRSLVCEVNVEPPNPRSMAFHARQGFDEVGRLLTTDGRYVALLQRRGQAPQ